MQRIQPFEAKPNQVATRPAQGDGAEGGRGGPDGPDRATSGDGSDSPYRAASVSEVIVTLGGENRGADGVVHC